MVDNTLLAGPQVFPFTRLPFELRRQVLQHTDLIIPYLPPPPSVDPDILYGTPFQTQGLHIRHGKLSIPRTLRCCDACLKRKRPRECGSDAALTEYKCVPSATEHAYFEFPVPLLYASRDLAELAQDILFSCNRLVLSGDPFKSIEFLERQRPSTLKSIRKLEFSLWFTDFNFVKPQDDQDTYGHQFPESFAKDFPNDFPSYPRYAETYLRDNQAFSKLVSWIASHLHLENLEVSVDPSSARRDIENGYL